MAEGAPTFDFDEFEMKEFWQGELDMSKQARELYEEFVRLYLRRASLAPAPALARWRRRLCRASAARRLLLALAAAAAPVRHADQYRTSPPARARASRVTGSRPTEAQLRACTAADLDMDEEAGVKHVEGIAAEVRCCAVPVRCRSPSPLASAAAALAARRAIPGD